MTKVLVTGFDPFGGEKINPAYEAVKKIPDTIAGAEIIKLEVPTVFGVAIDVVTKAIDEHKPDVVLCIGQAGGRFDMTPERVAINVDDARIPDNAGAQPLNVKIKEDGEAAYFSTLPVRAMVDEIKKAGIPASLSNTAGTFVCNNLMYGVLYHLAKHSELKNTIGGFMHIPFLTEQVLDRANTPSLSLDQMAIAVEAAIKATLMYDNDIALVAGKND